MGRQLLTQIRTLCAPHLPNPPTTSPLRPYSPPGLTELRVSLARKPPACAQHAQHALHARTSSIDTSMIKRTARLSRLVLHACLQPSLHQALLQSVGSGLAVLEVSQCALGDVSVLEVSECSWRRWRCMF